MEILARYLRTSRTLTAARVAPYGQVHQHLVDRGLDFWKDARHDFALVWTQPQKIFRVFNDLVMGAPVSVDQILDDVDAYCEQLKSLASTVRAVLVPTWVHPGAETGYSMLDVSDPRGISNVLMKMNLRLAGRLAEARGCHVLNAQRWVEKVGAKAFSPKMWYLAKVPFNNDLLKEAASQVFAAIDGILGKAKKLLILDLDHTLWGGILGDEGTEGLRLGGHDSVGEAYKDFQLALKVLKSRGILLAIASKNDEKTALDAIQAHPEMILKSDDFAGWEINWNDKAQNIVNLLKRLNLGPQSAVFVDDNAIERARVRESIPDILVPEWPQDPMLYASTLLSLTCFQTPSISEEDLTRTESYVSERKRESLKENLVTIEEWLTTLNIQVEISEIDDSNLNRAVQLFNKTNQMNLSTRRLTSSELMDWASQPGRKLWTLRVNDRFGDSGLTGILGIEQAGLPGECRISDFILSCRVMGRQVEETMLAAAIEFGRSQGARRILAHYRPTEKNKPCLEFFQRSGFRHGVPENVFTWDAADPYPYPPCIKVDLKVNVHDA